MGLGFRAFGIEGFSDLGFRIKGLGFSILGLGFKV